MRKDLADIWQRLKATPEALAAWCARRGVRKFSVYGSVVFGDFRADSDINVLVAFFEGAEHDGRDAAARKPLVAELADLMGRAVTLADEGRLEAEEPSLFRRISILGTAQPLYEAPGSGDGADTVDMDIYLDDPAHKPTDIDGS